MDEAPGTNTERRAWFIGCLPCLPSSPAQLATARGGPCWPGRGRTPSGIQTPRPRSCPQGTRVKPLQQRRGCRCSTEQGDRAVVPSDFNPGGCLSGGRDRGPPGMRQLAAKKDSSFQEAVIHGWPRNPRPCRLRAVAQSPPKSGSRLLGQQLGSRALVRMRG